MKLSIVIVNFQKYQETINCLKAILRYLPKLYTRNIILIDNDSDEKYWWIRKKFPQIKIIQNKKNYGFAKAINQGIGEAIKQQADYILLLNNDTIFDSDFLTPMIRSNLDLVSPILKFKRKGEWWYDFGGRINWIFGRPYHLETKNALNFKFKILNLKLDYLSGCCLLIKRKVFEKIGLFDEKFFLYFEDVDFCLRAKKTGFKIGVCHKSLVTHLLEEKKSATRLFKLKNLLDSQINFIKKWLAFYFKLPAYLYYYWLKYQIR